MKRPEILAPAGSMQALKAAVMAGCDAVYMGGSRFGARAYAENPEKEEMLEAIRYCHLHDVKLYMTVNTLFKDREMQELYDFLAPYCEAGVDAVLVQDFGVLSFLRRAFPSLNLHASTQMTITQGTTAGFLKEYGVTRIVPARELTLSELRQMRESSELEIEVFVHGALCCCYSGQCLFSSMLGGRSGNRGRCAQPCRQPYRRKGTGKKEYLLSPKELCTLEHIGELIEMGVDSFKIEGRMKRAEYAAYTTYVYKKYTERYWKLGKQGYEEYLASHPDEWEEDHRNLEDLYNREGFTSGYLEGKAGEITVRCPGEKGGMLAKKRPKHGGVLVGRVYAVKKSEVVYESLAAIHAQDVVEFRNHEMLPSYEYTLGKEVLAGELVTARMKKGTEVAVGDLVYRTKNAALLSEIQERFLKPKHQIPVQGQFIAVPGKEMTLQAAVRGVEVTVSGEICAPAKNQPVTEDEVRKQLSKTGESAFVFEQLKIRLEPGLFISVGMLKKLRRAAFFALEQKILEEKAMEAGQAVFPEVKTKEAGKAAFLEEKTMEAGKEAMGLGRSMDPADVGKHPGALEITASVMTLDQLEAVLRDQRIQRVYLQTECMDASALKTACEQTIRAGKHPWLAFPYIFRSGVERLFRHEMERKEGLFSLPWEGALVKNLESFLFLRSGQALPEGNVCSLPMALDAGFYCMNDEAAFTWRRYASILTLPLELTWEEMKGLSLLPEMELIGYGKVPLMVSAQCVQKNTGYCVAGEQREWGKGIRFADEKGRNFTAVNYCRYCYNVIYQEQPVYLPEVLEDRKRYPVKSFRYVFTTESGKEILDILEGRMAEPVWSGHFYRGIL